MLDILKEKFNNEIATRIFSFCSHPTADIINKAIEDGEKTLLCEKCKCRCVCCLVCDICKNDIDFIFNDQWHIICFNCNLDKNITYLLDLFNVYYMNGVKYIFCKDCQDTT